MKRVIFTLFFCTTIMFGQTMSVFKVDGMHCPLCTTAVKKAIKQLPGIENTSAILNTKTVTVIYDEKQVSIEAILNAIKTTSYEGVLLSSELFRP